MGSALQNIRDFLNEHKGIVVGIFIALLLIIVISAIVQRKKINDELKRKEAEQTEAPVEAKNNDPIIPNDLRDAEYKHELGIDADKGDGRVAVIDEEGEVENKQEIKQIDPSYETKISVFDFQKVPDSMVDGSDIKAYLRQVNLDLFGSKWGSELTSKDFYSEERILVGVEQDSNDFERGDLQSVGWLINNLDSLDKHDAVKFTNLHVVGKLASDHNACLCCYDWYSAFGITDTLVVFEDISGTVKNFKAGDIFSCTVYVHNMRLAHVNGQNVVCIQYAPFDENKDY